MIRMMRLSAMLVLLTSSFVQAETLIKFDTDSGEYLGCYNIGESDLFLTDPNDPNTLKPGWKILPDGVTCDDYAPIKHPQEHLIVVDGDVKLKPQAEIDAIEQGKIDDINTEAQAKEAMKQKFIDLGFTEKEISTFIK